MKKRVMLAGVMLGTTLCCGGGEPEPRRAAAEPAIAVGRCAVPPVIDGTLDDAAWRNAPECPLQLVRSKTPPSGDRTPKYPTRIRLLADDRYLYCAIEAVNPGAERGGPGKNAWDSDMIGFFSDNSGGGKSGNYQMLILNRFGELYLSHRGGDIPLQKWKREEVRCSVRREPGKWIAELAIPRPAAGDFFGQLGRADPDSKEVSAAGDLEGSFHESFRFVRFRPAISAVELELDPELTLPVGNSELSVRGNNGGPARKVKASWRFEGRAAESAGSFELPPGRFDLKLPVSVTVEDIAFDLELTDEAGKPLVRSLPYRFLKPASSLRLRELEAFLKTAPNHPRLAALAAELDACKGDWAKLEAFLDRNERELARFRLPVVSGRAELLRNGFCLYALDSMEKVTAGEPIPAARRIAPEIELDGTPGGVANFQVAVVPFDRTVKDLKLKRFSFGDAIPTERLAVRREKEIDLGGGNLKPDVLSEKLAGDLAPEENSRIYYASCELPRTLVPGRYEGEIAFSDAAGSIVSYPIRLRVRGFVLPEKPPTLSLVSYDPLMAASSWSLPPEKIAAALKTVCRRYGLYPIRAVPLPNHLDRYQVALEPEWSELGDRYGFVFAGAMPWIEWFPRFYLPNPKRTYPTMAAYFDHLIEGYCGAADELRKAGRLGEGYAYYDEIGIGQEEIRNILESMKKQTGLKLITCFDKPFEGTAYLDYYKDLVDFFIFNNSYFVNPDMVTAIRNLQRSGRKVGWYFNVSAPACPTTFNAIDVSGAAQRLHYYKIYQYGVDATLFWGLQHFGGLDMSSEPWKASMRGNGFLVYPEDGKVIPSLRLELLREGIEDLAHLRLAEKLAKARPDHPAAKKIAELLKLEWSGDITQGGDIPPERIRRFRVELDDAIETLWKER